MHFLTFIWPNVPCTCRSWRRSRTSAHRNVVIALPATPTAQSLGVSAAPSYKVAMERMPMFATSVLMHSPGSSSAKKVWHVPGAAFTGPPASVNQGVHIHMFRPSHCLHETQDSASASLECCGAPAELQTTHTQTSDLCSCTCTQAYG